LGASPVRKNILVATNAQKVLHFLIDHPIRDFLESEIKKATKISKSGVNYALRELVATDFLFRTKRGKTFFYTLNHKNIVVKQLNPNSYLAQQIQKIKEK
jgi:DNA-binding transcriptional regulator GbsR (MarR family)